MKYKILLVDDDKALVKMLCRYLTMKGFEVLPAFSAMEALEAMGKMKQSPDLMLLDINMPGMDGMEFCRTIRGRMSGPILFLTARVEEEDRVSGLMSGGDDYVAKPFSLKELEARILAHLRREERHRNDTSYRFSKDMIIDYAAKKVQVNGMELELTKTEYEIIAFLSMRPGQVFDKERIYERVCGYDAEGDSRSITELIRRIRKKLSACTQTEYIETVWGMGYRWMK
ncbi:MAG: response regulator transcription factor [Eubacterium sp.]|nr:response regulator transcription factor [Eubacterium sp.]